MCEDDSSEDTTEINPDCESDRPGNGDGLQGQAKDFAVPDNRRLSFLRALFGKLFDSG